MKKKKPAAPKSKKLASKSTSYRFQKFTLPTFRSPLSGEGEISFQDEVDHAFFLRCCELYRVLELHYR
jgi:hypothetical protein